MVVVTILLILTTLVTVRLLSTQAGGRDQERTIDISTIANGLEVYYESGSLDATIPKGYYPGATQVQAAAATSTPFREFLEGVPRSSFEAPDRTIDTSFGIDPNYATSALGTNGDGSYSDTQARALLSTFPYLYQPLRRDNAFCANYLDCVKFNLYYIKEETDTVIKIRSKYQ